MIGKACGGTSKAATRHDCDRPHNFTRGVNQCKSDKLCRDSAWMPYGPIRATAPCWISDATLPGAVGGIQNRYEDLMPTILIIDDEELVIQFLERALKLHGYKYITAADGQEGW